MSIRGASSSSCSREPLFFEYSALFLKFLAIPGKETGIAVVVVVVVVDELAEVVELFSVDKLCYVTNKIIITC